MTAHESKGFGLQLDSGDYICGWMGDGNCMKRFGGPERVRTVDLFHAMEARSQVRHRPTLRGDYNFLIIATFSHDLQAAVR
jgi:hypothetical protein